MRPSAAASAALMPTLLNDCMRGDATLFDRADGVEAAWALVDPILEAWRSPEPVRPELRGGKLGAARSRRTPGARWTTLAKTLARCREKSCPGCSYARTPMDVARAAARRFRGLGLAGHRPRRPVSRGAFRRLDAARALPPAGHQRISRAGGLAAGAPVLGRRARRASRRSRTAITAWCGASCLLRVPIPPGNVHRMEAEDPNIGRAAQDTKPRCAQYLELDDRGFPRFHLVLLGMGADGHTASLFPGSKHLRETSRWVSTPMVAKLGMRRMTLTLPVLEAARTVLFLVTGADKAATLREVLCGESASLLAGADGAAAGRRAHLSGGPGGRVATCRVRRSRRSEVSLPARPQPPRARHDPGRGHRRHEVQSGLVRKAERRLGSDFSAAIRKPGSCTI